MAPILLLLLAAGGVALIARSSSGAVRAPADHVVDSGGKLDSLVVAAKDETVGLAAIVLYAILFTVELALSLVSYFGGTKA